MAKDGHVRACRGLRRDRLYDPLHQLIRLHSGDLLVGGAVASQPVLHPEHHLLRVLGEGVGPAFRIVEAAERAVAACFEEGLARLFLPRRVQRLDHQQRECLAVGLDAHPDRSLGRSAGGRAQHQSHRKLCCTGSMQ
eukprot:1467782-Prymnesium_polylepis.2